MSATRQERPEGLSLESGVLTLDARELYDLFSTLLGDWA